MYVYKSFNFIPSLPTLSRVLDSSFVPSLDKLPASPPRVFEGNNARLVEKERKRWINKNSKVWTNAIKPGETVFSTNRTNQLYGSTNLIDELDIRRWKNIVGDDTDKLWLVIKRKNERKSAIISGA